MSSRPVSSFVSAILAAIVAAGVCFAGWWHQGRAVPVPNAPSDRIPCLSYAPQRGAETPFDKTLEVSPAHIEEDLKLLSTRTKCVRTYAVDQGIENVPGIAAKLGMKVMLGAWIGRDPAANAKQIRTALALARQYPGTVTSLIIGNEVLLRREMSAKALGALLYQVKEESPVPVTYADVWEFWLKNPSIASDVDFITIHILPYWEDDPVPIGSAVAHVTRIYDSMKTLFPQKPIFIGETGWPSAGRMRRGARPSLLNEARFVRGVLRVAARDDIRLNIVEAFDQPWKRALEGTVGGYWGVFNGDRTPKFPLSGPVSDDPAWPIHFLVTAAIGLVVVAYAGFMRAPFGWKAWLGYALAGQAAGSALTLAAIHVGEASLTIASWIVGITIVGAGAVIGALIFAAFAAPPAARWTKMRIAGIRETADVSRLKGVLRGIQPADLLSGLRFVVMFGAAATTLCILFDARYRDFPVAEYAVPAVALLAFAWRRRTVSLPEDDGEELLLARLLAPGGLMLAVSEGPQNFQAMAWFAVCLALSAPFGNRLFEFLRRRPAPQSGT